MHSWLRLSAGLAMGLTLWTGTALAQTRPACEKNTPRSVGGEVTKVDMAQGRVTVRESDGTMHEFQASKETLENLKVGGHIEAKLREAPTC
jgi:hypothetical protein